MIEYSKKDLEEITESLIEREFIDKNDKVEIVERGDYWERFIFFNMQTRGYYYFSKERIVFIGGALGNTSWSLKYKDIKNIKKCNIALFIPTGIKIEYINKKGKLKVHRLSMSKRNKWLEYISSKIK